MDFFEMEDEFTTKDEMKEEIKRLKGIIARNKQNYLTIQREAKSLREQLKQAHAAIKQQRINPYADFGDLFKNIKR